ncbi:MAG TPA: YqaA family protein [Xanthobacteraceae bacterium]|jgi:membrane protein YqaA with SNARE-associated domain|nr:YqaA family protein [Xanthobacteraceae bacterium]
MLRRLYNWVFEQAAKPWATKAVAAISFAESSFFPIPPDVMLVPMCLAQPKRAFFYAGVCTISSVLGGLLGYAIGALLYDTVGQFLIQLYGYGDKVEAFRAAYAEWGAWIILIKGATPIPYKLVTITSGFAGYNLLWFTILSLITRGARFYLFAALLYYWGEPARDFIEKRLGLVLFVFVAVLIGGFYAAIKLF